MATILQSLANGLDRDVRRALVSRVEAMEREFRYLSESQNERYASVNRAGWSRERLSAVAALNAFYQLVLGPLASSARDRTGVLGNDIPILYGELLKFDRQHARQIMRAYNAFMQAISTLPLSLDLLTANRAQDIVFTLSNAVNRADGV